MTLTDLVLKAIILLFCLRDTFDALRTPHLADLGRSSKPSTRAVRARDAPPGTPARREPFDRQRIGSATRRASVRSALMVILVWNLGMMFEPFCDRTLAWVVPFYDTIKTLCLMWFLVTRSLGSQMLFNRFVVPIVSPYEPIIDAAIHASARLLPLAYVLLGWLRIRSGDLYAGLWSQGRGDDAHASATIEEISPLQDRRAVRTENTKPRTPEAAVSTFDRQQPKPRSALQKARVISQRQQHEQRRSSMADQRSSEQEARPSKPAAASPAQKTSSRAPDAAVPSSSPTSDRSPALPTFAFVPPAAIPGTPANPAALLSPPPKLPGHFQFAFIPPPFQDAVDVRQKQAERSINANPASELDVSSRVSAANGTEEASPSDASKLVDRYRGHLDTRREAISILAKPSGASIGNRGIEAVGTIYNSDRHCFRRPANRFESRTREQAGKQCRGQGQAPTDIRDAIAERSQKGANGANANCSTWQSKRSRHTKRSICGGDHGRCHAQHRPGQDQNGCHQRQKHCKDFGVRGATCKRQRSSTAEAGQ
ncbi:uncharacterized protein PSFLO_00830 [Pseudozyma flocculosa]|uniref:Protein YOP1 n=1 Tax=Pseudozyma flocculosa TaxID=84751 RepID=A0A5C3EW12_9BASI|nr:uncharacterized protein PSFLO_00830 [Pseudozyma flocculosa]